MKSLIKVSNIKKTEDINKIKKAITNNEGTIACEINKETGEVNIVFSEQFIDIDNIIESIEDLGYIVL